MSITLWIIILTAVISISAFGNRQLMSNLIFYPPAISQRKQWYRFVTCGFIHADFGHLIFNMLSLYMFGNFVEDKFIELFQLWGKAIYLILYIPALIVSILPTYSRNINNSHYSSLGASGAVSAVVFAGLMIAPYVTVGFFIIPPIIPGFIFGPLYLIISAVLDQRGGGNINHSAHIWGALFGIAFLIVVGRIWGDYDAIEAFKEGVQYYLRSKGINF